MTWGLANWATYPWGFGAVGAMSITQAYALGPHIVRVYLSKPPRARSVLTPGDALNPQAWLVSLADGSRQFTVISVQHVINEVVWDLYVLQEFEAFGVDHRVRSLTIRDKQGVPISDPNFAIFGGAVAPLKNPLVAANPYDLASNPVQGTLEMDSSGDFKRQRGKALIEKLIIRRLTTLEGGFTFMPGYGLGLRVKEPLVGTDIVKLQADIERQLLREIELETVKVRVRLESNGTMTILVRATMQSGEAVSIPVPVNPIQF